MLACLLGVFPVNFLLQFSQEVRVDLLLFLNDVCRSQMFALL